VFLHIEARSHSPGPLMTQGHMPKDEENPLVATSKVGGAEDARSQSQHKAEELAKQELPEEMTGQQEMTLTSTGETVCGTESDLDENAYGAAAVALVRDIPKLQLQIRQGVPWPEVSLTLTRLGFSLGVMIVNLAFQTVMLCYIWVFVVSPSVRNVQVMYADFHLANFDSDGNFDHEAWASYDGKSDVCSVTMSSRTFYFGILTLWGLLMMQELRGCQRVFNDIWGVRSVDRVDQMLDYVSTGDYLLGGRCLIIGLTKSVRASVIILVCIPRTLLALGLLFLGCQWLSSAASFSDMTLNAMALEFVKNIDELLYDAILPRHLKTQIAETNVFKIEKKKTKGDLDKAEWTGYKRTVGWIAFMVVYLAVYGFVVQTVLPFNLAELAGHCQQEIADSEKPLCSHMNFMSGSESCYPYGSR